MSRTTDATTQLAPFSLHPEHFRLAEAAFHAAGDRPIKICLDVDDTIIQNRACEDTEKVVLNDHLINALTTLLNRRDNLSNVEFFIVSARCDDSERFECKALLLEKILESFIPAINAKITPPRSIEIKKENIYCFRSTDYEEKIIAKLTRTEGAVTKIDRKLVQWNWVLNYNNWISYDRFTHFRLQKDDHGSKGIFFREFLIPTQDIRSIFLFFDDNEVQIEEVRRAGIGARESGTQVHCVQVIKQPKLLATAAAASLVAAQPATTPTESTALLTANGIFTPQPTKSTRKRNISCPCIMM